MTAVTFGNSGSTWGASLGIDNGTTLESAGTAFQLDGPLIDCLLDPGRKYFICGGLLQ